MKNLQAVTKEERLDIRDGVEYCKHNIQKEWCSFCNGEYAIKKEQEMKRFNAVDIEEIKLKSQYTKSKDGFSRFGEPWLDGEVSYVKDIFKDIQIRGCEFRKLVLKVSLKLERTKGAISWMYELLFKPESSLVRGKVTLKYMQ